MSAPPARATVARAEDAAGTLRARLAGHTGELTVADAAARSGLALRDAESGLHFLLARHRGHLSVTRTGELLFRFPDGFSVDWERRGRIARAAGAVAAALAGAVKFLVRVMLTVFLVGYAIVFALVLVVGAIALSIAAEDSGPAEAVGLILWGVVELVADAFFWTAHPFRAYEADRPRRKPRERARGRFYDRVNALFFGPEASRADPLAERRALATLVRACDGRIGVADVLRATGGRREDAEAALSRLMLDHDGEVRVTEAGAIVYEFAALRRTADPERRESPPPPFWAEPALAPALTGNTAGQNVAVVLLTSFNAGMGWACLALGLPWYLAELPLVSSAALLVLPLVRAPLWLVRRAGAARERGRRAVLRTVLERTEGRGDELVPERALAEAWKDAAGRPAPPRRVREEALRLGGEAEVAVEAEAGVEAGVDSGGVAYRFRDLHAERRALAEARKQASPDERAAGAIEFSSSDP